MTQLEQPTANDAPKSEWIGVEERLPEEEGWYLCALSDDIVAPYVLRVYFVNNRFIISEWHKENTGRKVTHWMPLPEPPKGANT